MIEQCTLRAAALVGMSVGGLTAIMVAAVRPDLVRRTIIVDVTPGSADAAKRMSQSERGATALIDGPRRFSSRGEMVNLAQQATSRAGWRTSSRSSRGTADMGEL